MVNLIKYYDRFIGRRKTMSKKCNTCGIEVEDSLTFCPRCGNSDFSNAPATEQFNEQPTYGEPNGNTVAEDRGNGNVLAGFVGALLFAIIGGLLYFVIYQLGIIAGICGLVIFILANFGYGLFAGTKNKASVAGLISAIIAMLAMIFIAEYFCISFEIFQVFKEYDITFFDAFKATPEFLAEPELSSAFAQDLIFAYLFGIAASIGNIANIVKARKKKQ